MAPARPLDGLTVVDLSYGIAGGYCTKLLVDGGARVVKLEPPDGDPLRRWAIGATVPPDEDGALFQFLACGKESVVVDGEAGIGHALELVRAADAIVWSPGTVLTQHPELGPAALRGLAPHVPVVTITPFGLDGPWADRPWTEFTLQAWGGGIWHRGEPDRAPVQVGGRIGEWGAGAIAAVGALTALGVAEQTGDGQLVDVSILESIALTHTGMYPVTYQSVAGRPFQPYRRLNLPGIEPTKDGYVGFMVVTGQQWQDFCVLIGRSEWMADPQLAVMTGRAEREHEVRAAIREYTTAHTTAEVVELASMLRVPVAPIGDGTTVTAFDHFVERKAYLKNPRSGFLQPSPAMRLPAGEAPLDPAPPPRLGEHTHTVVIAPRPRRSPTVAGPPRLPLDGVRVADFTMFWAGPIVGSILAALGAEVIHIESPTRPDGMRFMSARAPGDEQWWEWAPLFMAGNTNKRGVAIDLQQPRGRELALQLVGRCDVVLENFSPRVMDNLGLGYDAVRAVRPDVVMVRMSAFGLDGPWRDRTGYAQTQEQVSGMASITGWPDREPMIPNGPCDPLAGVHATVAVLLALAHRRRTGAGMLVDVPMVGGALNAASEVAIEYSAYGQVLERMGNRGPAAVPQNLYRTADTDEHGRADCWVAIAVADDAQWRGLRRALGEPAWAGDRRFDTADGRRAAHDELDQRLGEWCATRSTDDVVTALWSADVPVGRVVPAHEIDRVEQLVERGYFEELDHPLAGRARYQGFPARFSAGPDRLHRAPSPTLGGDNDAVLVELLGIGDDERAALRAAGVIGESLS